MILTRFMRSQFLTPTIWILSLLFLIEPYGFVGAQTIHEDCIEQLKRAELEFRHQKFADSIQLINDCLGREDFPPALKANAYELLARNYLALNYLENARSYIKKLLELVNNYAPSLDDPPGFAAEVKKVQDELTPPNESGGMKTWHWVAIGVLGVGAIVGTILLLSGGSTVTPTPLPDPPGRPAQ